MRRFIETEDGQQVALAQVVGASCRRFRDGDETITLANVWTTDDQGHAISAATYEEIVETGFTIIPAAPGFQALELGEGWVNSVKTPIIAWAVEGGGEYDEVRAITPGGWRPGMAVLSPDGTVVDGEDAYASVEEWTAYRRHSFERMRQPRAELAWRGKLYPDADALAAAKAAADWEVEL